MIDFMIGLWDLVTGLWRSGCLIVLLIFLLIACGIGGCDYMLTKSALIDLRGKEPKPSTVIWVMLNGDNARARVEKR